MGPEIRYVGEQETSGACLQWVRDHLALDEIGLYLEGKTDPAQQMDELYTLLNRVVDETRPGAGNLIFTPWLHGNRAPREDAHARGMFFNIGISTGKRQMIRAVLEGVALHKRWILEAMETKIPRQERIVFVGGGPSLKSGVASWPTCWDGRSSTSNIPKTSGRPARHWFAVWGWEKSLRLRRPNP